MFNLWITQYIFSYQVDDFIASVEGLGTSKFTDTWELGEKFNAIAMEQSVKNKIAATLVSKKLFLQNLKYVAQFSGFQLI